MSEEMKAPQFEYHIRPGDLVGLFRVNEYVWDNDTNEFTVYRTIEFYIEPKYLTFVKNIAELPHGGAVTWVNSKPDRYIIEEYQEKK